MNRETIVYNGVNYHRYPDSKRRQHRRYYWSHINNKSSPIPLHRQLWVDNFGPILKGFHIHHKDGNTLNNSIENLELISASDHARYHSNLPERIKSMRDGANKRLSDFHRKAKEWRNTTEGKAFYKEHYKNSLLGSESIRVCIECKIEYKTLLKTQTKYCSAKCGNRYQAREFRKRNPFYYRKIKPL